MAKQRTDTEAVLKLVIDNQQAKTSSKELQDSYRKLTAELNNMKKADNPALYAEKARNVKLLKDTLAEMKKEQAGATEESKKFHASWKTIAAGLVGGFGIGAAIGFLKGLGQEVFNTIAKFQKMEAVLTTTLGTKSEALMVMQQIQDFAAKTPYQVDELTGAFVKLANQGFRPNVDQMRSLGDLAASTGKDFDQLAEAIIDAQTGEFERLKEFGVRASKQGDIVKFTFRGVTEEVNFSADAIRNYITELGNAEGVAGSMAAISETLGGQVSNLSDNWTMLLKTVGEQTQGVFAGAINVLNNALGKIKEFNEEANLVDKYNLKSDYGLTIENGGLKLKDVSGQGAQVQAVQKQVAGYVAEISKAAPSIELYNAALKTLSKDGFEAQSKIKDGNLAKAIRDQYVQGIDAIKGLRSKLYSDEASAAQSANETAAAAAEKAREKAKKVMGREADYLQSMLDKMQDSYNKSLNDRLDKNASEEEAIKAKYAKERREAEQNLKDKSKLSTAFVAIKKAEEAELETLRKKRDKEETALLEKLQQEASDEFDAFMQDRETAQEEIFQGLMDEHQREQLAVDLHYEELLKKADLYGLETTEIYKKWGLAKAAVDAKQAEKDDEKRKEKIKEQNDAMIEGAQLLSDTIFTIGENNRRAETDAKISMLERQREYELSSAELTQDQKNEINKRYEQKIRAEKLRAWRADKLAAMSQAVINGALAVVKSLPNVVLAALAGGAAAAQVAVIAAQKPPQFAKGGIVQGPSHAEGGIKLVDGISGALIGEMEGGERILSRSDTQRVDDMLYGRQRMSAMNVNAAGILEAERTLRYGVTAQGAVTASGGERAAAPQMANQFDTRTMEDLLRELINSADNAWNYRLFEKKKERYDGIRNDLDA